MVANHRASWLVSAGLWSFLALAGCTAAGVFFPMDVDVAAVDERGGLEPQDPAVCALFALSAALVSGRPRVTITYA